jgi:quinol monooxygenase YgiN
MTNGEVSSERSTPVPLLSDTTVVVFATLWFPPGEAQKAVGELRDVITAFQKHDGFIAYDLSQDCANPNILRAAEIWTTRDCLNRHAAHADVARWNATLAKYSVRQERYMICAVSDVEMIQKP